MKLVKVEKWLSIADGEEKLKAFANTLRRIQILEFNTPPEEMDNLKKRFELEFAAVELLTELADKWESEAKLKEGLS